MMPAPGEQRDGRLTLAELADEVNGCLDLPHGEVAGITVEAVASQPGYVTIHSPRPGTDEVNEVELHESIARLYLEGALAYAEAELARGMEDEGYIATPR